MARSLKCKDVSVCGVCLRAGVTPPPPPPPTTTATAAAAPKTTVTSGAGGIIHEGERRGGKGGSVCAFKDVPFMTRERKVEALQDEISLSIAPHLARTGSPLSKCLFSQSKFVREFVTHSGALLPTQHNTVRHLSSFRAGAPASAALAPEWRESPQLDSRGASEDGLAKLR